MIQLFISYLQSVNLFARFSNVLWIFTNIAPVRPQVSTAEEQVCSVVCGNTRNPWSTRRAVSSRRQGRTCTCRSTWLCRSETSGTARPSNNTKPCSWWLPPNPFILHIKVVRLKILEESRLTRRFDRILFHWAQNGTRNSPFDLFARRSSVLKMDEIESFR